ncbi:MAG: hypothetical protein K8F33_04400, partial [Thermomonas sp.]|uniref:hypothetical protein n=1 Tax=Thermomonas sp. TaxID=1971895 RepID=UPI001D8BD2FE
MTEQHSGTAGQVRKLNALEPSQCGLNERPWTIPALARTGPVQHFNGVFPMKFRQILLTSAVALALSACGGQSPAPAADT